jgi:N-acetylglucosamine kinase-like BadF-type ATPase
MTATLLAVDGGNSKTDVVLLDRSGAVLAAVRGPTVSHQAVEPAVAGERLAALVRQVERAAGRPRGEASLGVLCLAGVDSVQDVRLLSRLHGGGRLAVRIELHNDTRAVHRAGTPEGWGVAVVVGEGINALGVSRTGREIRFAALGPISGDRGGGSWLGMEALGAAVRAQDGRGPATSLSTLVPAMFGLQRPLDVTFALYRGRIVERRVDALAPVAVQAARDGDAVALAILDTLAESVAEFARAAIRRGGMVRTAVPVVLAGGVARGADPELTVRVAARVRPVAPGARVAVLHDPPVVGAALLALDGLGALEPSVVARVREGIRSALAV